MERELKISMILKQLMKTKGETITSLSRQTGVPKSTIADWLASRTPNPTQVAKIASCMGVSLHFLLFGSDDPFGKCIESSNPDVIYGLFEVSIKRVSEPNRRS